MRGIHRYWWVPVVALVIGAILGYGASRTIKEEYTASTQLLVVPSFTDSQSISSEGSQAPIFNVLIVSGPVLDRVIIELGLDLTRQELSNQVASSVLGGGQIIEVTVTDEDPQRAADIANSIARNFEVQVLDLTTGEFERTLDSLVLQSDQLEDQITVLDTRLVEIDIPDNADDSDIQAEIRRVEKDRLQLSQKKADIDATIRNLNSQLSTSSPPVAVADFAQPATQPISPQPALMALFGAFLGGLLGAALLLYLAMQDSRIREGHQVVSLPLLARSDSIDLSERAVSLVAARLQAADIASNSDVVVVTPRVEAAATDIAVALHAAPALRNNRIVVADNLLGSAAAITAVSGAAGAMVVAQMNTSSIADLEEVDALLRSLSVPILGTILLK